MASWTLLIQLVMCAIIPCCTGSPAKLDEDGNSVWQPQNKVAFWIVTAIKWIGFIFLFGGIVTVIDGVYQMTPETVNGRGSVRSLVTAKFLALRWACLAMMASMNRLAQATPESRSQQKLDTSRSQQIVEIWFIEHDWHARSNTTSRHRCYGHRCGSRSHSAKALMS